MLRFLENVIEQYNYFQRGLDNQFALVSLSFAISFGI